MSNDNLVILGAGGFAKKVYHYAKEVNKSLVILGTGGFAKEVYHNAKDINYKRKIYFADDYTDTTELYGEEVIKNWKFHANSEFIIGVGSPKAKKIMIKKALEAGLKPAPTLIHPTAIVQDVIIGFGGIICPNVVITANIKIGDYVTINIGATIGHDTTIGHFTNIAPGVNISGNNYIGMGCDIGTNSATKEKIEIISDTIIGMCSGVTKSITEPGVYIGTPARRV